MLSKTKKRRSSDSKAKKNESLSRAKVRHKYAANPGGAAEKFFKRSNM
jgi:hypothetical protein